MQHWEPMKIPRTNLIAQTRGVFLKLTAARVMFLIFRPLCFWKRESNCVQHAKTEIITKPLLTICYTHSSGLQLSWIFRKKAGQKCFPLKPKIIIFIARNALNFSRWLSYWVHKDTSHLFNHRFTIQDLIAPRSGLISLRAKYCIKSTCQNVVREHCVEM